MRIASVVTIGVALVALTGTASARLATTVSRVKVAPSPFYSDEPIMRVTFRTAAPAPAGRRYYAFWQSISGTNAPRGCSPASSVGVRGNKGGTGTLVRMWLRPERTFGGTFCAGRSRLVVFTQLAARDGTIAPAATKATYEAMARLNFRVRRPY